MLPPGHWRIKLKICRLFHANNYVQVDAEIKSYKDGKTIWIYHNHYWPCTYDSKRCRYVCNCYYYDRAVHISVAVDMRTLLDRKKFSSSSNDQVAAHRVTGLIIKRLWMNRQRGLELMLILPQIFSCMVCTWQESSSIRLVCSWVNGNAHFICATSMDISARTLALTREELVDLLETF